MSTNNSLNSLCNLIAQVPDITLRYYFHEWINNHTQKITSTYCTENNAREKVEFREHQEERQFFSLARAAFKSAMINEETYFAKPYPTYVYERSIILIGKREE